MSSIYISGPSDLSVKSATVKRLGKHGPYLWIVTNGGRVIFFTATDPSTIKHTRRSQQLEWCRHDPEGACVALEDLLNSGVRNRGAGQGWKLTDGERSQRGTGDVRRVGVTTRDVKQSAVLACARQLYSERGGSLWPTTRDAPSDLSRNDFHTLLVEAFEVATSKGQIVGE